MTKYIVFPEIRFYTSEKTPVDAIDRFGDVMVALNKLLGATECITWKDTDKRKAKIEKIKS